MRVYGSMGTVLRRLLVLALLPIVATLAAPPAQSLSCVGPSVEGVLNSPGAVIGKVLDADLDHQRVTLAVEETVKGGPFPARYELPAWGMGWDDWESTAMRAGPVLFSLFEQKDGSLATGACSFYLDPILIAEVRAAAPPVREPSVVPAIAEDEPRSAWYLIGGVLGAGLVVAVAALELRRRLT